MCFMLVGVRAAWRDGRKNTTDILTRLRDNVRRIAFSGGYLGFEVVHSIPGQEDRAKVVLCGTQGEKGASGGCAS